jgi:GT2 family glycosyltransferase
MSSPRVTVIIATYNWSTVLPFSIGSVLAQTCRDFEVLVVGDCCTDDSESVVAALGDSRVRWINLPKHTGHQSAPNNRGLLEANGEFIAYLGHDDLWLPHHLQCSVDAIEASGAGVAYSLVGRVGPGEVHASPGIPMPEALSWSPPSGMVHRRNVTEAIGAWKDYREVRLTPEAELWRRAHAAGFGFVFVPRLTAIKFPAAARRNVYRERPCHEQASWLRRIATDRDFEPTQLANMINNNVMPGGMSGRPLIRLLLRELGKRLRSRLSARSRFIALCWPKKGAEIEALRTYKGL